MDLGFLDWIILNRSILHTIILYRKILNMKFLNRKLLFQKRVQRGQHGQHVQQVHAGMVVVNPVPNHLDSTFNIVGTTAGGGGS